MPQRARYLSTAVMVAAALTAVLVLPGTRWPEVAPAPFVILLSLLVVLVLTVRLPLLRESPAGPAIVSVLLASVVLLPPGAAALIGAAASLFMVLRRADPLRVAFSCAVAFLTAAAGGEVYTGLHGCRALTAAQFPAVLLPIALAVVTVSAVPAILIEAYLVAAAGRDRVLAVRDVLLGTFPRNLAYAAVGLLTAVLWNDSYDALATLVLLGPVAVTRWATVQAEEQRAAHDAIISTLVQAVEIKDLYTRGHSERVARLSGMIAAELRLPPERAEVLRYAATLHDVGKLGVPTRLLRKTGPLDDAEFDAIRLHPARGVEVVQEIAFLDEAYSAILHHHERMDGSGYPSGLRGPRIPPLARIIAVADAFDAMTSTRSYRQARGVEEAVAELRACAGTQLDPAIVNAMINALAAAAAAGRTWRGDGSGAEPEQPPVTVADLPPGAVVAEFDHDDLAYLRPIRFSARVVVDPDVVEAEAAEAAEVDVAGVDVVDSGGADPGVGVAAGTADSAVDTADSGVVGRDAADAEARRTESGVAPDIEPDASASASASYVVEHSVLSDQVVRTSPPAPNPLPSDLLPQNAIGPDASRPSGVNLPAQTGHGLDVLDPAETAADPREVR